MSNIRELLESDGTQTAAPGFKCCGRNGCIEGWRPVGPGKWDGYQRCQCRIDWIESVKASGGKLDMEAIRRAEYAENWKQIEAFKRCHGGLTPQQYYVREHREELEELWKRIKEKVMP